MRGFFSPLPASVRKWAHWEYWPAWLANIPVVLFWLWFALRARKLLFFTAVNPAIETGGVLGESKYGILKRIPAAYVPKMLFVKSGTKEVELLRLFGESPLQFPLMAKPDVGERGLLVEKIKNEEQLLRYFRAHPIDVILQEYITYPEEVSVLYYRFPGAERGKITSLCLKKPLTVKGDGQRRVEELMRADLRAALQLSRFRKERPELLAYRPARGEQLVLEYVGNHCKGTTFLDGNALIDERLERVFDEVARQMRGIHYGRFDLKCNSLEDLKAGKNFAILEFNGIAGEPAHVYDPHRPMWKAYRDFYRHWKVIYDLYKAQKRLGVSPASWGETWRTLRYYVRYMRLIKKDKR